MIARERSKRPVWLIVTVAVVGLVGIGWAQQMPNRDSIEDNLTRRSAEALQAAGISGAQVDFVGRDGKVVLASRGAAEKAREIVAGLDGVRVVEVVEPAEQRLPTVTLTVENGRISAVGVISDGARTALRAALGESMQDRFTVDPAATDAGIAGLGPIVRAVGNAKGVTIELRDGRITLTGKVDSAQAKDAAEAAATAAIGAGNVVNRLEIGVEQVQKDLIELPPITFEDDSAILTPAGQAAVARAAELLRANPAARVRIEGHTDGNGTPAANLVLSQARAKSVLDALVSLGVSAERLTSEGFGESRPKVPDTSPENRAINRRVEFVVLT